MQMANKILSILMISIISFLMIPFGITANAAMPELVKIGLFYGSSAKNYYTITANNGMAAFRIPAFDGNPGPLHHPDTGCQLPFDIQ